jgi:hypothetical protein
MDENGRSLVTQDDIKNLRDNADTIISERIPHYQKLAHDNPIPSVRGFYLDLVGNLYLYLSESQLWQ